MSIHEPTPSDRPAADFSPSVDLKAHQAEIERQKFGEFLQTLESLYDFGLRSVGGTELESVEELVFENDEHKVNGYPFNFSLSRVEEDGKKGYKYIPFGTARSFTILPDRGYCTHLRKPDIITEIGGNLKTDSKLTSYFDDIEGMPLSITATVKTKPIAYHSGKSFS